MCGIAGFSLAPDHDLDTTALARVLLAGIVERGRDATGYAYRTPGGPIVVRKDSQKLVEFIEHVKLDPAATEAILHVREFTKGIPGINDNNHPVSWGRVVGVHNGHLTNDDELFDTFRQPRSTPLITVDSEVIMMLTDVLGDVGTALEHVQGAAAVGLLHDDHPGVLHLARRSRRPLVLGRTRHGALFFASTRDALKLVAEGAGLKLQYEELGEGTAIDVVAGEVVERRRFRVDGWLGHKITAYPHAPEKHHLVRIALASLRAG
jgi:glucosamine--fructose-6-phosphate aminotransferase (isomerizing)